MNLEEEKAEKIASRILRWGKENFIHYPWREEDRKPYEIFLAELMLQKTNAEKVEEVYEDFLGKYPSFSAVLKSPAGEIAEPLEFLGLQNLKAERLKKSARIVTSNFGGNLPAEKEKLKELPGVGDYIASSVLCFGFEKRIPIVDVNVSRIFSRAFFGEEREISDLGSTLKEVIPRKNFKKFNYGLLDLGKKKCTSRSPNCEDCPLRRLCSYTKTPSQEQ